MKIGALKEIEQGEARVAMTPDSAAQLQKLGHECVIETGAGAAAGAGAGASMQDWSPEEQKTFAAELDAAATRLVPLALHTARPRACLFGHVCFRALPWNRPSFIRM